MRFLPSCAVPMLFGKLNSLFTPRGSSSSVERSLSMREVQGSTPWSSKDLSFAVLRRFATIAEFTFFPRRCRHPLLLNLMQGHL